MGRGRYKGFVLTPEQRRENRRAHWRRMAKRQREQIKSDPERLKLLRQKQNERSRRRRAENPLLYRQKAKAYYYSAHGYEVKKAYRRSERGRQKRREWCARNYDKVIAYFIARMEERIVKDLPIRGDLMKLYRHYMKNVSQLADYRRENVFQSEDLDPLEALILKEELGELWD